ncbi:MAG: type III-B CRISPR module RAMP protein Cmr4 [Anaerolineae bacterium]
MQAKLLLVHALSPLHAGTGQGVDVIDLPIAREKATGIPYVPGSTIKGVLRDACQDDKKVAVFGPETSNASEHAGSAQFSDARLLLLPVRSLAGTFAWVTSPLLLRRFVRDAQNSQDVYPPDNIPEPADRGACCVANQSCALLLQQQNARSVVLEDLLLAPTEDAATATWGSWLGRHIFLDDAYWQDALRSRLCIVHDDVLSFLLQTATDVTARIQLESAKKTVKRGALWYEEALPAETILSGLVVAAPTQQANLDPEAIFTIVEGLTDAIVQIGGNATVGRGLCQLRLI